MASPDRTPPATPRPAASLILLRGDGAPEVLMGRRGPSLSAFPGTMVFPGGKVGPQDATWPDAADDPVRAAAYAALREAFEETGLLLAVDAAGVSGETDPTAARRALEAGELTFAELMARWSRVPEPARLVRLTRFVTPEDQPYRFDTLFFVARVSRAESETRLVASELGELAWLSPAAVLANEGRRLMLPTEVCLTWLAQFGSAAETMEGALVRPIADGSVGAPLA